jgi:hypothetical protein
VSPLASFSTWMNGNRGKIEIAWEKKENQKRKNKGGKRC